MNRLDRDKDWGLMQADDDMPTFRRVAVGWVIGAIIIIALNLLFIYLAARVVMGVIQEVTPDQQTIVIEGQQ